MLQNAQCTQWTTSLDLQWKKIPKSKSNPKPKKATSMNKQWTECITLQEQSTVYIIC